VAQCLVPGVDGYLQAASAPIGDCTTLVALSPAEYQSVMSNPLFLTLEQGALIGGAIAAVWASAWGIRVILGMLRPTGASSE